MTVDAVIVGSGPGGSAVADVLTRAGWSVVIIEKGRNHLLDPDDLTKPAADYSNDELKFIYRHFLGPDPLIEPRTFRRGEDEGDHVYVGEVNSIPTTVGGGGTHADGKVPRFREEDFTLLSTHGPIEGAEVADWPLSYDDLEPFYAEAERSIGVAGTAGANPFAAWRSGPYPMPSGAPMYGAVRSSAAAEALGLHPYAAPTAANSVPYDGRPACNNCGFCAFFGCPIHAKGDPVALVDAGHGVRQRRVAVGDLRVAGAHRRATCHRRRCHRSRRDHPEHRRPSRRHRRRCGRDAAAAAAVGDRQLAGGPELHGPLPDLRHRHLPRAPPRPQGSGRDPCPRRRRDRRRRSAGRCRRGGVALDPGRPRGARRAQPARHGGQDLPVGGEAQVAHALLTHAGPHVGLHHAG